MSGRPVWVACLFSLAALALLGGLARVTQMTLALERSERAALQRAIHEENIRIALWRMDATLAEWLAEESRRPAQGYTETGESTSTEAGLVKARFELGAERRARWQGAAKFDHATWLSALELPEQPPRRPRSATGETRMAARSAAPSVDEPPDTERTVSREELWAQLRRPSLEVDALNSVANELGQQPAFSQEVLNTQAFTRRQELAVQNTFMLPPPTPTLAVETPFASRWLEGELLLTRAVLAGSERRLQGAWLDLPALSRWLASQVSQVVPGARLERSEGEPDPGRQLALLPLALVPGPPPEPEPPDWTPIRWTLAAAWAAALLCLVGVGGLLAGSVRLAERRADFVSAVTHELRTPLTTFKLYTDLLAESAGTSEERAGWLETLRREAGRLGYLVDNVLAFSKLEHHGGAVKARAVALGELLAPLVPRLAERAEQAGLHLEVELPAELAAEKVRAEASSVEQILFNLVDNACKYAGGAEDRRLHLAVAVDGRRVLLRLSDHGPGLAPDLAGKIFRPFHRSATAAAGSAPGVGLGLALSRRLARRMGGELVWVREEKRGAAFELRLRRLTAAAAFDS